MTKGKAGPKGRAIPQDAAATSGDVARALLGPTFAGKRNASGGWVYDDEDTSIANYEWSVVYGFELEQLDAFLASSTWNGADQLRRRDQLIERRGEALDAWRKGQEELAVAWLHFLHVAMQARLMGLELRPLAQHGAKMREGRKPGTVGSWRKCIRQMLQKDPSLKNAAMWTTLQAKPPRGWTFLQNRYGEYFEGPAAGDEFSLATFRTYASEERAKLRKA